jgi:TfoX/Sxy family transcriptional regulator of competence genes
VETAEQQLKAALSETGSKDFSLEKENGAHICNPSTWRLEQEVLEFEASLNSIVRLSQKKKKKKKKGG